MNIEPHNPIRPVNAAETERLADQDEIVFGSEHVVLNTVRRKLYIDGKEKLMMTDTFSVLAFLANNLDVVLNPDDIFASVWPKLHLRQNARLLPLEIKRIAGQLGPSLNDPNTGAVQTITAFRPKPTVIGHMAVTHLG